MTRLTRAESRAPEKRSDRWPLAALLLGLCFAQGVFYVAKVGNLYVDVIYPVAAIVLVLRIVFRPAETERNIFQCFDRGMLPVLLLIILSFVLVMFTTTTHVGLQINSYVNGLVVLAASIAAYLAVISLKDYVDYLLKGLWIGLVVSTVVSIAQYVAFQNGGAFTLYGLFPQPAFYISVPWGAASSWASNAEYLVYSYRAQGLYLECSYFVAAATMIYLVTGGRQWANGLLRTLVLVILFVLFAMSGTGNIVLFFGFVVLAHLLRRDTKAEGLLRKRRNALEWLVLIVALFLLATFVVYLLMGGSGKGAFIDIETISKGFSQGVESADITGGDNEQRFLCMSNALAEFLENPWGVGYNMAPPVLAVDFGTNTTFSYFLTLLVELGLPGLAAYGYFAIRLVARLLGDHTERRTYRIGLAMGILALIGYQVGNGSGLIPIAWCLFALAAIETSTAREGKRVHGLSIVAEE